MDWSDWVQGIAMGILGETCEKINGTVIEESLECQLKEFLEHYPSYSSYLPLRNKAAHSTCISAYLCAHLSLGHLPYRPTPMLSVKEKHVLFCRNLAALVTRVR